MKEGQHVNAGDELFDIDPVPFQLALQQAQSKLDCGAHRFRQSQEQSQVADHAGRSGAEERRSQAARCRSQDDAAREPRRLAGRPRHVTRRGGHRPACNCSWARSSRPPRSTSCSAIPICRSSSFPAYQQAKAALDQAQRDLDHTVLKAPIAGTATQVDNIQLGRFVTAGTPVFSVIDDAAPWVDANPKETDITYLRLGQKVDDRRRRLPRSQPSTAPSPRSAPAPARNSRSCRRRTPSETG